MIWIPTIQLTGVRRARHCLFRREALFADPGTAQHGIPSHKDQGQNQAPVTRILTMVGTGRARGRFPSLLRVPYDSSVISGTWLYRYSHRHHLNGADPPDLAGGRDDVRNHLRRSLPFAHRTVLFQQSSANRDGVVRCSFGPRRFGGFYSYPAGMHANQVSVSCYPRRRPE